MYVASCYISKNMLNYPSQNLYELLPKYSIDTMLVVQEQHYEDFNPTFLRRKYWEFIMDETKEAVYWVHKYKWSLIHNKLNPAKQMTDSDTNKVFNEYHRKLFEISESHLNRHTIALMSARQGIIRPLGSGVFFHDQGMYFIFTAAHVVKDYPELLVQGPEGVIYLSIPDAYIYYHPDNKLDVAFILL